MSKNRLQELFGSFESDNRALGEATTVVLLIIVAVAAAGTVSIAISGFTSGIAPDPGATVNADQQGEDLVVTVDGVDDGVEHIEFRGQIDDDDAEVANGNTPEDTELRFGTSEDPPQAGDVITLENVDSDNTVTIVALDGEGGENNIETVEIGATGA